MHSAKRTTSKFYLFIFLAFGIQLTALAQENSPYSRYGVGDLVPNHNMQTRGMGGISAAIADFQGVNSTNPASYSNITNTVFDMGAEVDTRKLKSTSNSKSFSATNALFSYMQLGFPIKMKKANKNGTFIGAAFGLKPISRINYKLSKFSRVPNVDSLVSFYEGSGGINQAFIGGAIRIKNLSIGVNASYTFGSKNYSTQLTLLNDSVFYHESNSATKSNFGGFTYDVGVQYDVKLKNKGFFRIGAYGNTKQKINATKDVIRETIAFNSSGEYAKLDSVYENNISGKITLPTNFGIGFIVQKKQWLVGLDFEQTNWSDYRFFNEPDFIKNNWKIRFGSEYFPATEKTPASKYFNFVRYRFGFFYGPDYVSLNNNLPEYGITFGAGFPLKLRKSYFETQTSILNTAIEFGGRGNKNSSIKENILRISFGLQLSDIWFRRAKYD
jgi:hypothetical protein